MLASLAQNTLKICHALRAPLFTVNVSGKVPFCGFWSDDTRIKKLFLLFFLSPVLCRRAQRAEIFVFSLGFFVWNGLRAKIERLKGSSKSSIFLSGNFSTPEMPYIVCSEALDGDTGSWWYCWPFALKNRTHPLYYIVIMFGKEKRVWITLSNRNLPVNVKEKRKQFCRLEQSKARSEIEFRNMLFYNRFDLTTILFEFQVGPQDLNHSVQQLLNKSSSDSETL